MILVACAFASPLDRDDDEALPAPELLAPAPPPSGTTDARRAAAVLQVDLAFAEGVGAAVEAVYARDYGAAAARFSDLGERWPNTGLGAAGAALIWQARMFENMDFRYVAEYESASDEAQRLLRLGLEEPGMDGVELFLLAGMQGIEGMQHYREGEWVAAIGSGLGAVRTIARVKELLPEFVDARVGDGIFLFWRTVVAERSPLLPRFTDRREEGLRLLREVERDGVLVGPAASLVLAYSYAEAKDLKGALGRVDRNRAAYPKNVVNNLYGGRILTALARYDQAAERYARVLADVPDNRAVHFHLGVMFARTRRLADAERSYLTFLSFPDLPTEHQGEASYRLGTVAERRGDAPGARRYYAAAVAKSRHPLARARLRELE